MTLDILICSLNKGIVRIGDMLRPARENVRYIVSYQYTDDRYLELIPEELKQRTDVSVYKYRGQGLPAPTKEKHLKVIPKKNNPSQPCPKLIPSRPSKWCSDVEK